MRMYGIFGVVAFLALLAVVGLGRTHSIDVNKSVSGIPGGMVPHGGAEKPVADLMTSGGERR